MHSAEEWQPGCVLVNWTYIEIRCGAIQEGEAQF